MFYGDAVGYNRTMNLDLAVLVLVLLAAAFGYRSGAVRQVSSWVGLTAAFFCARPLAAAWGPQATKALGWSPGVAAVTVSVGLWLILYIGASQVARVALNLLEPGDERGPLDQGLGAVVGAAKGGAIAFIALSILIALEKPLEKFNISMAQRTAGSRVMAYAREHSLLSEANPRAGAALKKLGQEGAAARENLQRH